ncbi:ATP-binding protein [Salmonella enterica subsp. diarizonae]|nr:ATP-binding protein [Salmonella enterica subsp. diarizonae]
MRLAKFNDGWRRTQDLSNYHCQLRKVLISDSKGIFDKFCLELNNGISVICGKNGVGKSTILKSIYSYIKKDNQFNLRLNPDYINISLLKKGEQLVNTEQVNVNYLEPSVECNKIINFLNDSENIEDFIEGLEPNGFLGKKVNIDVIGNIIGRNYSEVEIYEVEGALADDYTFPFIKVTVPSGEKYTCLEMGAGEYLCMYIFWYINWIDEHSILLIDEIENCISIYSQEYLMDYLAYVSSQRGIWTLLSSHSEAILNKVGINNARLIFNIRNSGISVVSPKHERKYFTALGIKPRKKGVFLVEDKFSSLFLNSVLNRAASDVAYDYHIVSFKDGESDIEKIVKHFNPNKSIGFSFFAVFDADMRKKINKFAGNIIPVISLPSIDGLNPEEELWRVLTDNMINVAKNLGIEYDDLSQYYEQCNPLDHHDRFMNLACYVNVSEEVLFNSIFSVWFANNTELVNKFIFSIIVSISNLKQEEINALASDMGLDTFNFRRNSPCEERVYFDGNELLLK